MPISAPTAKDFASGETGTGTPSNTYPTGESRLADVNWPLIQRGVRMGAIRNRGISWTEIITGVERRRRWGLDEKLRIVGETEQPNTGIAAIAWYEISRGLLWNWRSLVRRDVLRPALRPVFLPVRTISEP